MTKICHTFRNKLLYMQLQHCLILYEYHLFLYQSKPSLMANF